MSVMKKSTAVYKFNNICNKLKIKSINKYY